MGRPRKNPEQPAKPKQTDLEQVGQEVVKRKRRVGNPAMTGESLSLEEGDNRKYMSIGLELYNMDRVDLHDPEAVRDRITTYFRLYAEADVKPTVTGLAMALGIDRRRLWEISTGNYSNPHNGYTNLPEEVVDSIKKSYSFLGNMWENYMQNGKINPVSGIFLGKNNFGYKDTQDVIITPNNPESDYSEIDIRNRYTLPTPDPTSDSDG